MKSQLINQVKEAIENGDVTLLEKNIANADFELDFNDYQGSWLHMAAKYGQVAIGKELVAAGLDINNKNGLSDSPPLEYAVSAGQLEFCQYLISCGVEFDLSESVKNPLIAAITQGHPSVVKLLIESGIDVSKSYIREGSGEVIDALYFAKRDCNPEIIGMIEDAMGIERSPLPECFSTEDTPFTAEDTEMIQEASRAAREVLGICDDDTPKAIQKQIHHYLRQIHKKEIECEMDREDAVIALACLWGDVICEAFGWEWRNIQNGEWHSMGVVDSERKYLALPLQHFNMAFGKQPDDINCSTLMLYKCIETGNMPKSTAGMYSIITEN